MTHKITHKIMPTLAFSVYSDDGELLTNEALVFENRVDKDDFMQEVYHLHTYAKSDPALPGHRIEAIKLLRNKAAHFTGYYPSLRLAMSIIDNGLYSDDPIDTDTDSSAGC